MINIRFLHILWILNFHYKTIRWLEVVQIHRSYEKILYTPGPVKNPDFTQVCAFFTLLTRNCNSNVNNDQRIFSKILAFFYCTLIYFEIWQGPTLNGIVQYCASIRVIFAKFVPTTKEIWFLSDCATIVHSGFPSKYK